MNPEGIRLFRASIVDCACFIEDLVEEQAGRVSQYVILGAVLDSFVRSELIILVLVLACT